MGVAAPHRHARRFAAGRPRRRRPALGQADVAEPAARGGPRRRRSACPARLHGPLGIPSRPTYLGRHHARCHDPDAQSTRREQDRGADRAPPGGRLGYPLFAEELVNMLRDRDALALRDGLWVLEGVNPRELATPPSIEALLDARLGSLQPEERAVVGSAAVIGARFRASEVAALASPAQPVEAPTVATVLRSLARRELISPVSPATPGAEEYQ